MNIRTSGDTMPKARNAYSVGRTPLRFPPELFESRHAIAAAARPKNKESVRAAGAVEIERLDDEDLAALDTARFVGA